MLRSVFWLRKTEKSISPSKKPSHRKVPLSVRHSGLIHRGQPKVLLVPLHSTLPPPVRHKADLLLRRSKTSLHPGMSILRKN